MTNFGDQFGKVADSSFVNKEWINRLRRYAKWEAEGELKIKAEKTLAWIENNIKEIV